MIPGHPLSDKFDIDKSTGSRLLPLYDEEMYLYLAAVGAAVATFVGLRNVLKKTKQLAGMVVVITGASSGIGEGGFSILACRQIAIASLKVVIR